jgi:hypothetical protein
MTNCQKLYLKDVRFAEGCALVAEQRGDHLSKDAVIQ